MRSWSHAFLITYDKTLTKNLLAVRPEKVTRRKKRKKKKARMAIAKPLNANARTLVNRYTIILGLSLKTSS